VSPGRNLGGRWHGIYNYPHSFPPMPFEAELAESQGLLSGKTSEPGPSWAGARSAATATIRGRRDGRQVGFSKVYDDEADSELWVEYAGLLSADGNEIAGSWTIYGEWSGTFLMVRQSRAAAQAERRVAVEL
jgi:hypothetical protein